MILVLCDAGDEAALWAADGLRGRGLSVSVVHAHEFVDVAHWEHRLGGRGLDAPQPDPPVVEIRLSDGRRISSAVPAAVLNRLSFMPTPGAFAVAADDRDYAVQEMNALFLSWLAALPGPVVNRPSPQGLGGCWRHPASWVALAVRAGLPVEPWRQSNVTDPDAAWMAYAQAAPITAFVVGEEVIPPPGMPAELVQGCRRMAGAAGETLLGIGMAVAADGAWQVTGATPRPDLRLGGAPMLAALARVLAP